MRKECGLSIQERVLDFWRGIYSIVIPSACCIVYLIFSVLIYSGKLNWSYFWEGENFTDALGTLVTFISIAISFFGVLIPILISGKTSSETIKFFFSVVDKKYFLGRIKVMMISGVMAVVLLALLYFSDIYSTEANIVIMAAMIWLFFYFVAASYRIISLLLMMFLVEKKMGYKGQKEDGSNV